MTSSVGHVITHAFPAPVRAALVERRRGWKASSMPLLVRVLAGLALAIAGGCQCGESLESLEPDIAVEPSALDFSRARVGAATLASVQVGNRGTGRLDVAARIEPEGQGFFVEAAPDFVRPRLAERLTVRFTPPARGRYAATLVLSSNDPDTPVLRVPLTGEGGPPILRITPEPVDLGVVNEGPGASARVRLENIGFDTLSLLGARLDDGRAFTLAIAPGASLPAALEPGAGLELVVALAPDAAAAALADEDGVLRDVLLVEHGDGTDAAAVRARVNLAPVAVAVELVTRRKTVKTSAGRAVVIDGSGSYDPEGDPFTFVWSLAARPEGSVASLVGQGQETTRVTPDAVGRYAVLLRVIDVHGAFSEDVVELLPRDLGVVLRWSPSGAAPCLAFTEDECRAMTPQERAARCCDQSDLDLHLIRPGGALGDYGACPAGCDPLLCGELDDANVDTCRQLGSDCAFANRAPDWGAPGRQDDPRLDIDDVRGRGPEITSLDEPEEGVYRVMVHYCRDDSGEPSLATVEVLVEGVRAFLSAPEPMVVGQVWTAATLIRSDGQWQVVPSPGFVEQAPPDLCSR
jgi:hypothetical protein